MLTDEMLRSGLADAMPAPTLLTAGALSCLYAGGELRDVRWGGEEVVRRLYVAVRDRDWGTVPIAVTAEQIQQEADGFTVTFTATHHADAPEAIAFRWRGTFTAKGQEGATLSATMEGAAEIAFHRNRIGWCVLHPPETCAGQPCTITHPDDTTTIAPFPVRIAPHQPFVGIRQMTHAVPSGARVTLAFDGDTFETEDQRNWTDDSYKTYGTPLALPFPVRVEAGEEVGQSVTLWTGGKPHGTRPLTDVDTPITLTVADDLTGVLPEIGFGIAPGTPLTAAEIARLRLLRPGHLRFDLHGSAGLREAWNAAAGQSHALGASLLIALFLPADDPEPTIAALVQAHRDAPAPVTAFVVFDAAGHTTPAPLAIRARIALQEAFPDVPVGGGTDADFVELNRARPPVALLDLVSWSVNPQVHAFDNTSVMETLAGQAATVMSARAFAGGLPLVVSPVTLRPRTNPNATSPAAPDPPLPPADPRQHALFGAAWTLASIACLEAEDIARVTYYETLGPAGLIARDAETSSSEIVYPLYHVFAAIAGIEKISATLPVTSSAPRHADALCLVHAGGIRLLVANLRDSEAPHIHVRLPYQCQSATVRLLDSTTARDAMHDPAGWWGQPPSPLPLDADGAGFALALTPYAVACVDLPH